VVSANSTCVTYPRLYISLPFHIVHHVVSRSGQRRMKVAEQSGLVYNWYLLEAYDEVVHPNLQAVQACVKLMHLSSLYILTNQR